VAANQAVAVGFEQRRIDALLAGLPAAAWE
jgi:hypothetical protein